MWWFLTKKLLINEHQESYKMQKSAIFVEKIFEDKYAKDKKQFKVRGNSQYTDEYTGSVQSICNWKHM